MSNIIEEIKEKIEYLPKDLEIEWEQYGTYNIRYNLNCKLYLNVIDLFSYYGYKNYDFYQEHYSNFIELLKVYNLINEFFYKEKEYININKLNETQLLIFNNVKRLYEDFPKNLKFNEKELFFDYNYCDNNKIYLNINNLLINSYNLNQKQEGIKLGRLLNLIIYFINNFNKIF